MGPRVAILKAHPEDVELGVGEEGEVCVEGACVTHGYLLREHMATDPIPVGQKTQSTRPRLTLGFRRIRGGFVLCQTGRLSQTGRGLVDPGS